MSSLALSPRLTAPRCLGYISTAFIKPDGGRANIAAKTLATLWYLLILPDAQSRLHRQLHAKRPPWYSISRLVGIATAAGNILCMPLSWAFLAAGRRNASRLCAVAVLLNPPSISLTTLLVTELSAAILQRGVAVVKASVDVVTKPFRKDESKPTDSNTEG